MIGEILAVWLLACDQGFQCFSLVMVSTVSSFMRPEPWSFAKVLLIPSQRTYRCISFAFFYSFVPTHSDLFTTVSQHNVHMSLGFFDLVYSSDTYSHSGNDLSRRSHKMNYSSILLILWLQADSWSQMKQLFFAIGPPTQADWENYSRIIEEISGGWMPASGHLPEDFALAWYVYKIWLIPNHVMIERLISSPKPTFPGFRLAFFFFAHRCETCEIFNWDNDSRMNKQIPGVWMPAFAQLLKNLDRYGR